LLSSFSPEVNITKGHLPRNRPILESTQWIWIWPVEENYGPVAQNQQSVNRSFNLRLLSIRQKGYRRWINASSYSFIVTAHVILTHLAAVKLTRPGEDAGLLAADYVDSGGSSGNQGIDAARCWNSRDGAPCGLGQYDPALFTGAGGLRSETTTPNQT
jgi:hypothetical protein